MISFSNLYDNPNFRKIDELGAVKVFEFIKDYQAAKASSINAYFDKEMNIRKRQVLIDIDNNAFTVSAGAMQWTTGTVKMVADVKGVGDLIGKAFASKVTKESTIKPKYEGKGLLMLEPTFDYILLENVEDWNGLVIEDGLFLACESKVVQKVVTRGNLSSALLGGEGLFNLSLSGAGVAVLESPVPREELIQVNLDNDEIRIDGSFAIAWSQSLQFTVEKSSKNLLGAAVSGEGFVNVYRGTGSILMKF